MILALSISLLLGAPGSAPTAAPGPGGRLPAIGAPVSRSVVAGERSSAPRLGMNISSVADWEPERVYADAVKTLRLFQKPGAKFGTQVVRDAAGWPMEDVILGVVYGLGDLHGTYALSFRGQATIGLSLIHGTVSGQSYDARTNTTTATIRIPATEAATTTFQIALSRTRRTAASATGTGVTDIKLMRPQAPGSATPFPRDRLFSLRDADGSWTTLGKLLRRFEVIRFMGWTWTNGSVQSAWSDRILPSVPTVNTSSPDNLLTPGAKGSQRGAPWEHLILFANEVFDDAASRERGIWINVPHRASDAYVLELARLLAYGSDGVNPYTSRQARPVYPPLDPRIKIYVEYSNELWNWSFSQATDNLEAAKAEVAAYPNRIGPLSYDREPLYPGGSWGYNNKRVAKRTVEISNMFRSVFGDAAMMTRIRPVIGTQAVNHMTSQLPFTWIFNFYGNGDGTHWGPGGDFAPGGAHASTVGRWTEPPDGKPHPPSYYVYGGGGTTYYSPKDTSTTTAVLTSGWMSDLAAYKREALRFSADYTKAFGLQRVAYEGGPSYDAGTRSEYDASQLGRPASPNQTDVIVDHQRAFDEMGGDLNTYFLLGGDRRWSFLPFTGPGGRPNVFSPESAKLAAIDELLAKPRAPVTYGNPIPSTATAFTFGWECTGGSFTVTNVIENVNGKTRYLAYLFRADRDLPSTTVRVSRSGAGGIQVYVDGSIVPTTDGGTTWTGGAMTKGLHGVIVKATGTGKTTIHAVTVK